MSDPTFEPSVNGKGSEQPPLPQQEFFAPAPPQPASSFPQQFRMQLPQWLRSPGVYRV